MRTDDLALMLATGSGSVQSRIPARRITLAMVGGIVLAFILMAVILGIRPDIARAVLTLDFWIKLGFAGGVAAASLAAVARLSRPGHRLGLVPVTLAMPFASIWVLAAAIMLFAETGQRTALLLGQTWAVCPLNIVMLATPVFVAIFWAVKGLAPTRLELAGAAAGLLAGATGAVVYSLHCPEIEAPFLATWYVIGMLIPAAAGWLLGPRVLRW